MSEEDAGGARVEFCGECYELDPARPFVIGREGDLEVDANPSCTGIFWSCAIRTGSGGWRT